MSCHRFNSNLPYDEEEEDYGARRMSRGTGGRPRSRGIMREEDEGEEDYEEDQDWK